MCLRCEQARADMADSKPVSVLSMTPKWGRGIFICHGEKDGMRHYLASVTHFSVCKTCQRACCSDHFVQIHRVCLRCAARGGAKGARALFESKRADGATLRRKRAREAGPGLFSAASASPLPVTGAYLDLFSTESTSPLPVGAAAPNRELSQLRLTESPQGDSDKENEDPEPISKRHCARVPKPAPEDDDDDSDKKETGDQDDDTDMETESANLSQSSSSSASSPPASPMSPKVSDSPAPQQSPDRTPRAPPPTPVKPESDLVRGLKAGTFAAEFFINKCAQLSSEEWSKGEAPSLCPGPGPTKSIGSHAHIPDQHSRQCNKCHLTCCAEHLTPALPIMTGEITLKFTVMCAPCLALAGTLEGPDDLALACFEEIDMFMPPETL